MYILPWYLLVKFFKENVVISGLHKKEKIDIYIALNSRNPSIIVPFGHFII
jgi:hypothetical protein